MQTRRQFLNQSLTAASAFAIVGCRHTNRANSTALEKLRAKLHGRLILPADSNYEKSRRVFYWNAQNERRPIAIIHCAHTEDVLRSIDFARNQNLEVAVRSGGHSHLGWGVSDGIVIDLSGLKRIDIDPARRIARIQAGALSGEVAAASGVHGLAPVLGQCPAVGASGVTLGGGLGWLSGIHSASCDNLLSAEIMTADAKILTANSHINSDLLWALKGAGANFGVTTSFDLQLHPINPVTAGDIHYPLRDARRLLAFFRELMDAAPDTFQATLNLTPGERGVFISFCHCGDTTEAAKLLQSLRSIAPVTRDTVKLQDFAAVAERAPATNPSNTAPTNFRCIQTVCRDQLSDDVIDIMTDALAQAPAEAIMGISHYMHGAVCRISPQATAFPIRQHGTIQARLALTWENPAEAQQRMTWTENTWRPLRPKINERIYANFQTYETNHGSQSVYGPNHTRLLALKTKYDPANHFHRNSNIIPIFR